MDFYWLYSGHVTSVARKCERESESKTVQNHLKRIAHCNLAPFSLNNDGNNSPSIFYYLTNSHFVFLFISLSLCLPRHTHTHTKHWACVEGGLFNVGGWRVACWLPFQPILACPSCSKPSASRRSNARSSSGCSTPSTWCWWWARGRAI